MPYLYPYDLSTFGGRLNTAMDQADFYKVLPLAKASGVIESTIRAYLTGRARNPGHEQLAKLAKALGVTEGWLATGEGPMRPQADPHFAVSMPTGSGKSEALSQIINALMKIKTSAAQQMILETVLELTQDMNEDQLLTFRRGLRDLARKVQRSE